MTALLAASSRSTSSGCSALAAMPTTGRAPVEAAAEVPPEPTATTARTMAREGWYLSLSSASDLSTLGTPQDKMTAIFRPSLMLCPASPLHQHHRVTTTTFSVLRRMALASVIAGVPPWAGSTSRPTTTASATTAVRTASANGHGHPSPSPHLVHYLRRLRQQQALACRQSPLAPPHLPLPRRLRLLRHGLRHRLDEKVLYGELQPLPWQQLPKSHNRHSATLDHVA